VRSRRLASVARRTVAPVPAFGPLIRDRIRARRHCNEIAAGQPRRLCPFQQAHQKTTKSVHRKDTHRSEMTRKGSQQLLVLGVLTPAISSHASASPNSLSRMSGSAASFAISMQLLALLLHCPGLTIDAPHWVPLYRAIEGLSAHRRKETIIDAPRTHSVLGLLAFRCAAQASYMTQPGGLLGPTSVS
jgi:hypothetical protein